VRIVRSTFRKIVRRTASWVTAGLVAGLLALVYLALGATSQAVSARPVEQAAIKALLTFPGAYGTVASQLLDTGGLFALAFAAAVAGSEWGWGTLKSAVARGESRWRYMLATLLALVLAAGVALIVVYAIGILAAVGGASLAGLSLAGVSDSATIAGVPSLFVHVWLGVAEEMAIGFAVAT